jgi:uncharacterized protein
MWYKITGSEICLKVYVKPNAKKSAVSRVEEQGLHLSLHAKPADGEANAELIAFLSELLKIPQRDILIVRGQKSRHKVVTVPLDTNILQLLVNLKMPY